MAHDLPVRELANRYLRLAQERPDADALIFQRAPFEGIRLSWADIADRSEKLLAHFVLAGMAPGARCAVTLVDHPDTVPALLALWRLDATAVLIDAAWGNRLRDNVLRHSGADFGLELLPEFRVVRIGSSEGFPHALPDGTAMLGYTSGSTGDPKGIPFTHSKLALTMHASAAAGAALRGGEPSRIACSARLSGSGTLNMHYVWAAFTDAAVVVLPELDLRSGRDYWSRIDEFAVDQTYLVPSLVEIVNHVARPRVAGGAAPLCLTGSAPLPARTQQRFTQKFGLPLVNCYGISEAMCAIFFGHRDRDGSATNDVGVPWLLQARLVDSAGVVVAGAGEGELQLAGPTLLDHYYGNPAATAAAFDGRWFRTGDVMRRETDGVYRIAGRSKDVVMKGGFAVYLNEVEEAALAIPDVLEAGAVGLSLLDGEDIGLLVRLDESSAVGTADVLESIRRDLGRQRAPRRVIAIADPLPRTGQNKLDRRAVTALWETEAALASVSK
ncbi:acyl--CoA ligase [Nocardia sp. 2]|uniref:Acyl--CoA ligase n=1 Tax=Nocardia acididurans TaxID=2802282 RepID=A0ABS1MF22_9NOCA|nr:class I adenylate-forming enzyme family protein [Nocardia acididurans]MBL1078324.1 acyl--CoA ligase [Nocardia acididurans]